MRGNGRIICPSPSPLPIVSDFGSAAYETDFLSPYIQSRPYRAPEVLLGPRTDAEELEGGATDPPSFDTKIDSWSTGALLAEMWTGSVLFGSGNVQSVLARIIAITCKGNCLPSALMTRAGARSFFSPSGSLFEVRTDGGGRGMDQGDYDYEEDHEREDGDEDEQGGAEANQFDERVKDRFVVLLQPKQTSLGARLRLPAPALQLIERLLCADPEKRASCGEAASMAAEVGQLFGLR